MKFSIHLSVWLLIATAPLASSQRPSYDPAANDHTQPRQGFTDFMLKQINSQNIDYGCEIEKARQIAVDQTVKNIDFWIISIALTLLILSFLTLLIENRKRNRLEVVSSRFLAQYHNSLIDARIQAHAAIRRHNQLVSTTDRVADRAQIGHMPAPQAAMFGSETTHTLKPKSSTAITVKGTVTRNEAGAGAPVTAKPLTQPNHMSDLELIAQIKTLRQQLAASHEREKNLKRELSKAHR